MSNYVHNLDPFAIQFPSFLRAGAIHLEGIRWYGLAYLAGFVAGFFVIRHMARRSTTAMKEDQVADFITMVAVGTMVGGRLGYCFFYAPSLLTDFTSSPPFWGVLKVYEGGMASHGGIMGVIAVCLWWARRHKMNPFHTLDLVTFGGALGIFFGRLANFVNGELWGREAPAGLSWAVKFPQEMYAWTRDGLDRLSQIGPVVEKLGSIVNSAGQAVTPTADQWRQWVQHYMTDNYSWTMVNLGVEQVIQAIQSGNEVVRLAIEPFLTARYPSQLIQAGLEGLGVFVILSLIWLKPRKPGVVSAWFGILYATARIIGEQFRMPDAQIGFQWLGLTRGQWLSIGMLALMSIYLYLVQRQKSQPMGGWGIQRRGKA